MPILNYTTQISTEKTAGEIQRMLVKSKARGVAMRYDDDGVLSYLAFQIETEFGAVNFKLPAHVDNIYILLQRDKKVPRAKRTREQAARVAWRIIKDWVEAQLALVNAGQVDMVEVFLPYAEDNAGVTVYEKFMSGGIKMLTNNQVTEE